MKVFILITFFTSAIFASSSNSTKYEEACRIGVSITVSSLPKSNDDMLTRGNNSCRGSLNRIAKSGELEKEKNIIEFACGYAVGSMFAKYGLEQEIKDQSKRFKEIADSCIKEVKKQNKN